MACSRYGAGGVGMDGQRSSPVPARREPSEGSLDRGDFGVESGLTSVQGLTSLGYDSPSTVIVSCDQVSVLSSVGNSPNS